VHVSETGLSNFSISDQRNLLRKSSISMTSILEAIGSEQPFRLVEMFTIG
jgi:hypothetical protein